jgi:Flp pilus assembly protein TadD
MAQIAMSYYFERDYPAALTTAQQAVAEHPHHPWAHRWLAASLGQLGHVQEATAALQKAIEVSPESFQFSGNYDRTSGRKTTSTC